MNTMSAAQTDLVVEQSHEHPPPSGDSLKPPGTSLSELAPSDKTLIAVDLDDVLSQTNQVVAEWHNDTYGTNMTLSDFYYYYYWKNPYWGTPEETFKKVEDFYLTDRLDKALPIEGALEGLQTLRELGFRFVVITARQAREMDRSWKWIEKNYPGVFETMICTGQSQETLSDNEVLTKLSKADVCRKLKAKVMIDDSLENALKCATATPPVPILLFGDNEWNQRLAKYSDIKEEVSFAVKSSREGGREFWKDDNITFPEGAPLTRVKDWKEVVEWVKKARSEGKI